MIKIGKYPTQQYLKDNFTYSDGRLYRSNGKLAGYAHKHKNGNIRYEVKINNKNFLNSRLIWIYFNGEIEPNHIIDHINSLPHDDRIENLQSITVQKNNIKRINNKKPHGYRGVTKDNNNKRRKKYKASICINYKTTTIGYFEDAETAAKAYDSYAKIIFEDFDDFNFPQ